MSIPKTSIAAGRSGPKCYPTFDHQTYGKPADKTNFCLRAAHLKHGPKVAQYGQLVRDIVQREGTTWAQGIDSDFPRVNHKSSEPWSFLWGNLWGNPLGKVPNVKKPTCSDPIPRCVSDVEGHIRVGTGKKWVTRIDSRILAEVPQGTTLNPRVPGNTTFASKKKWEVYHFRRKKGTRNFQPVTSFQKHPGLQTNQKR